MMVSQCTWDGTLSSEDFRFAARAFSEKWKNVNPIHPQWMWISRPLTSMSSLCEGAGYLSLENIYHPRFVEDSISPECYAESGEENVDCATLVFSTTDAFQLLIQCTYLQIHFEVEVLSPYNFNYGSNMKPVPTVYTKVVFYYREILMVQNNNQEAHIYDYHVVYNFSYKVPVLYFRGYQCDGQLLRSDEIQRDLPPHSLSILKESKWTYMTQEEHPFLGRPWYMLHPCGTSDWMKLLFASSQVVEGHVIEQYLTSWLSVVGQAVGLGIPLEMQRSSTPSLH